jgi:ADP-heptose:LPS heptosyltransferase
MKNKIRILTWGGVGDVMLLTPALMSLKKNYPGIKTYIYCISETHFDILKNNPHVDVLKRAKFSSAPLTGIAYYLKLIRSHEANYGQLGPDRFYSRKAQEIVGELLEVNVEPGNYPPLYFTEPEELWAKNFLKQYKNPIILSVNGKSCEHKNWYNERWTEVVEYFQKENTFIQIGLANEVSIKGSVNMLGKTTIREACALIKFSKGMLGVESAFAHAAGMFKVPAVILFGPNNPNVFGHDTSSNIYMNLPCSPCMSFLQDSACPYNRTCMRSITVEMVKAAVTEKILNSNPISNYLV